MFGTRYGDLGPQTAAAQASFDRTRAEMEIAQKRQGFVAQVPQYRNPAEAARAGQAHWAQNPAPTNVALGQTTSAQTPDNPDPEPSDATLMMDTASAPTSPDGNTANNGVVDDGSSDVQQAGNGCGWVCPLAGAVGLGAGLILLRFALG